METQALLQKMKTGAHLTPEEHELMRAYYMAKSAKAELVEEADEQGR